MSRIPDTHAQYPDTNILTSGHVRQHDLGSEMSPPLSPRIQPPDYCEDGAPPVYQEASKKAARIKVKKILIIRILSSLFIATIVTVIVAAAIGKIQAGKPPAGSVQTHTAQGNITGSEAWTTVTVTTTYTMPNGQSGHQVQVTTTSAPRPLSIPTQAHVAFDCPYFAQTTPMMKKKEDSSIFKSVCDEEDSEEDEKENVIGVETFSHQSCGLRRASYSNCGWGLRYRCTASCILDDDEESVERYTLVDDWEWDAG